MEPIMNVIFEFMQETALKVGALGTLLFWEIIMNRHDAKSRDTSLVCANILYLSVAVKAWCRWRKFKARNFSLSNIRV